MKLKTHKPIRTVDPDLWAHGYDPVEMLETFDAKIMGWLVMACGGCGKPSIALGATEAAVANEVNAWLDERLTCETERANYVAVAVGEDVSLIAKGVEL